MYYWFLFGHDLAKRPYWLNKFHLKGICSYSTTCKLFHPSTNILITSIILFLGQIQHIFLCTRTLGVLDMTYQWISWVIFQWPLNIHRSSNAMGYGGVLPKLGWQKRCPSKDLMACTICWHTFLMFPWNRSHFRIRDLDLPSSHREKEENLCCKKSVWLIPESKVSSFYLSIFLWNEGMSKDL